MKIIRTRVVTHIINKGLKKIKSPIGNLEFLKMNKLKEKDIGNICPLLDIHKR